MTESLSYLDIFAFRIGIIPMLFGVAICAQDLKIFFIVILSVSILMMHYKSAKSLIKAPFAKNQSIALDASCVSNDSIFNLAAFCRFKECCAVSRAKPADISIGLVPASNDLPTCLAWVPLNAFKRAILSLPAKLISGKGLIAPLANSLFLHRVISTFSGAIKLTLSCLSVMPLKRLFASQTVIHGGHYAVA